MLLSKTTSSTGSTTDHDDIQVYFGKSVTCATSTEASGRTDYYTNINVVDDAVTRYLPLSIEEELLREYISCLSDLPDPVEECSLFPIEKPTWDIPKSPTIPKSKFIIKPQIKRRSLLSMSGWLARKGRKKRKGK